MVEEGKPIVTNTHVVLVKSNDYAAGSYMLRDP